MEFGERCLNINLVHVCKIKNTWGTWLDKTSMKYLSLNCSYHNLEEAQGEQSSTWSAAILPGLVRSFGFHSVSHRMVVMIAHSLNWWHLQSATQPQHQHPGFCQGRGDGQMAGWPNTDHYLLTFYQISFCKSNTGSRKCPTLTNRAMNEWFQLHKHDKDMICDTDSPLTEWKHGTVNWRSPSSPQENVQQSHTWRMLNKMRFQVCTQMKNMWAYTARYRASFSQGKLDTELHDL